MTNSKNIEYLEWMTPKMVAKPVEEGGYEIALQTQAHYRCQGKIPYYKLNKFIRYRRSELDKLFLGHAVVGGNNESKYREKYHQGYYTKTKWQV